MEFQYRSKKDISTVAFLIIWIIFLFIYLWKNQDLIVSENKFLILLIITVTILAFYRIVWLLIGKIKIKIERDILIIEKTILWLSQKEKYDIKKIKNAKTQKNVESDSYWGVKGLRIYDQDRSILVFDYENKKIEIGIALKDFNAEKILKYIKSN